MATKNLARTVIEGGRYRSGSRAAPHTTTARCVPAACRAWRCGLRARCRRPGNPARCGRSAGGFTTSSAPPSAGSPARSAGRGPGPRRAGAQVRPADDRRTPHCLRPHAAVDTREAGSAVASTGSGSSRLRIDRHGCFVAFVRVPSWPRPPEPAAPPRAASRRVAGMAGVGAHGDVLFWFTPTATRRRTASTTVSTTPTPRSGDRFPTGSGRATIHWRRRPRHPERRS